MEFRDIERRPVVQQVAEQLREAVIDAVNRSQQFPGETSLSEALAVSRPTLREALRILEAEGLIARDARTSVVRPDARAPAMSRPLRSALTVLTKTEQTSLAEIMDLRAAIEERAVRRAAQVATPNDLRLLDEALDEQRRAAAAGEEVDTAGFHFRAAMVKASHNEAFFLVFLAAREAAADLLEHAAALATQRHGEPPHHFQVDQPVDRRQILTNEAILQAIREGRGDDAAALATADMPAIFAPLVTAAEDSNAPDQR